MAGTQDNVRLALMHAIATTLQDTPTLTFIPGPDGRFNAGSQAALRYLLLGSSGRDLLSTTLDGKFEPWEDCTIAVTATGIVKLLFDARIASDIRSKTAQWPNLVERCGPRDSASERELFKARAFVDMVQPETVLGMPLTEEWWKKQNKTKKINFQGAGNPAEKWPLVQSYGLDEMGTGGFLTSMKRIVDISPSLNYLFSHVDGVAMKQTMRAADEWLCNHWSAMGRILVGRHASRRAKLSEATVAEPIISFAEFAKLQHISQKENKEEEEAEEERGPQPHTRVLFGNRTNLVDAESRDDVFIGSPNDQDDDSLALHMTAEAYDPFTGLRVARTYMLSIGEARTHDDATRLMALYNILVRALQHVIKVAANGKNTSGSSSAGEEYLADPSPARAQRRLHYLAVDAIKAAIVEHPDLKYLGDTWSIADNLEVTLESVDVLGRSVSAVQEDAPFALRYLYYIQLRLSSVPAVDRRVSIGALVVGDSFTHSPQSYKVSVAEDTIVRESEFDLSLNGLHCNDLSTSGNIVLTNGAVILTSKAPLFHVVVSATSDEVERLTNFQMSDVENDASLAKMLGKRSESSQWARVKCEMMLLPTSLCTAGSLGQNVGAMIAGNLPLRAPILTGHLNLFNNGLVFESRAIGVHVLVFGEEVMHVSVVDVEPPTTESDAGKPRSAVLMLVVRTTPSKSKREMVKNANKLGALLRALNDTGIHHQNVQQPHFSIIAITVSASTAEVALAAFDSSHAARDSGNTGGDSNNVDDEGEGGQREANELACEIMKDADVFTKQMQSVHAQVLVASHWIQRLDVTCDARENQLCQAMNVADITAVSGLSPVSPSATRQGSLLSTAADVTSDVGEDPLEIKDSDSKKLNSKLLIHLVVGMPGTGKEAIANALMVQYESLLGRGTCVVVSSSLRDHGDNIDASSLRKIVQQRHAGMPTSESKNESKSGSMSSGIRVAVVVSPAACGAAQVRRRLKARRDLESEVSICATTAVVSAKYSFSESSGVTNSNNKNNTSFASAQVVPEVLGLCARGWADSIVFTGCGSVSEADMIDLEHRVRRWNDLATSARVDSTCLLFKSAAPTIRAIQPVASRIVHDVVGPQSDFDSSSKALRSSEMVMARLTRGGANSCNDESLLQVLTVWPKQMVDVSLLRSFLEVLCERRGSDARKVLALAARRHEQEEKEEAENKAANVSAAHGGAEKLNGFRKAQQAAMVKVIERKKRMISSQQTIPFAAGTALYVEGLVHTLNDDTANYSVSDVQLLAMDRDIRTEVETPNNNKHSDQRVNGKAALVFVGYGFELKELQRCVDACALKSTARLTRKSVSQAKVKEVSNELMARIGDVELPSGFWFDGQSVVNHNGVVQQLHPRTEDFVDQWLKEQSKLGNERSAVIDEYRSEP